MNKIIFCLLICSSISVFAQQGPLTEDATCARLSMHLDTMLAAAEQELKIGAICPIIDDDFRSDIVEQMDNMARKLRLQPATLFNAIVLFDRFMSKSRKLSDEQVFLSSLAAITLSVANFEVQESKFYLHVVRRQLVKFAHESGLDKKYNYKDVIVSENDILKSLNWSIFAIAPLSYKVRFFLDRFYAVDLADDKAIEMSQSPCFVLLIVLRNKEYLRFSSSHLAAAALYLTHEELQQTSPEIFKDTTGFARNELAECVEWIKTTHNNYIMLEKAHASASSSE